MKASTITQIQDLYLQQQQGGAGAEQALFAGLREAIDRLARRSLAKQGRHLCPADIDDVVQELLITIWARDLERYDPARGPLLPFLHARVRWRLIDAVRDLCLHADRYDSITPSFDAELEGSHPDEQLEEVAYERRLRLVTTVARQSLKRLKDTAARRAVVKHDLEGKPLCALAERVAQHPSTLSRARQRGIEHLRRDMRVQLRLAA